MNIHFAFNSLSPVLNGKTKFAGMPISNHKSNYIDVVNKYVEECDITVNTEDHIPTFISTLSDEMKYWRVFKMVNTVSELQSLIETAIRNYTIDDFSKCLEWDDFDDFILLLLITLEYIKNNRVSEDDLKYFNTDED